MDSQRFDLTRGDIPGKLMLVSLPIIGTQLMLMGYNLVDMFLLGRVNSDAVAASGSAGMYMWLGGGLMLMGRLGAEIGVAQAKGTRDNHKAMDLSRAPFVVNALGLALNAILDPLFIFTLGMDVRRAAVATSLSQFVGFLLSLYWLLGRNNRPFPVFPLRRRPDSSRLAQILRWTVPVSSENLLFTFFTMIVAREIARHGADAIAVYRVGSQAESLFSWFLFYARGKPVQDAAGRDSLREEPSHEVPSGRFFP